jgi:hypothetical protein
MNHSWALITIAIKAMNHEKLSFAPCSTNNPYDKKLAFTTASGICAYKL